MAAAAPLMVTISGIRGIAGTSLVPAVIEKYIGAFAALIRARQAGVRPIVLGRDSRVTGPWVVRIVQGLLMASGFDVVDIGIVPTPTVQFAVQRLHAAAGVVVTSSHNDVMWNGLKFVDEDGLFLSPTLCAEMFRLADAGAAGRAPAAYDACGALREDDTLAEAHVQAILGLDYIDVDAIRARHFKVVLDAINGAGGPIMSRLLQVLGCTVVGLNLETTGLFKRKPEPIPEHLQELSEAVRTHSADIGIAVDPDVDRCVLVDETGEPIGEEYTLAFAVKFMLGVVGRRGPVCKNLSSSRAVDDIASEYGCTTYAAPVGEINVAKKMEAVGAVIGGEGNGGVMLPDIHIGRDAPVAAALALALLTGFGGTVSGLKATLPQYAIAKHKAPLGPGVDADAAVAHFKREYKGKPDITLNNEDGLRIESAGWWVHLRKSNTEPILRVIGESGNSKEESDALCTRFMDEIKSLA